MRVTCFECALRACGPFKPVSAEQLAFINDMKHDHLTMPAGSEIIRARQDGAELYTLYSGWAFRFKALPDGRRQILNFLLPGDLLGLLAGCDEATLRRRLAECAMAEVTVPPLARLGQALDEPL